MRIIKRWTSRTEIKAVYPDDLEAVLKDAGLLDLVQSNELKCAQCGKSLTLNDIACLVRTEGSFDAICSDTECCRIVNDDAEGTQR